MSDAIVDRLDGAIRECNSEAIESLVDEVASYCYEQIDPALGKMPDDLFEVAIKGVLNPRFQRVQGAFHLLMLFQYDWGMLSDEQKKRLLKSLEEAFPTFVDHMACHVSAELLGRFFKSEAAFAALNRLLTRASGQAIALIPLGFEAMARETQDDKFRQKALAMLERLKTHSDEQVRHEALISLRRLKN